MKKINVKDCVDFNVIEMAVEDAFDICVQQLLEINEEEMEKGHISKSLYAMDEYCPIFFIKREAAVEEIAERLCPYGIYVNTGISSTNAFKFEVHIEASIEGYKQLRENINNAIGKAVLEGGLHQVEIPGIEDIEDLGEFMNNLKIPQSQPNACMWNPTPTGIEIYMERDADKYQI